MKKTIIALTLASLSTLAAADVTLYGVIKGGLEYTKVKGVNNTVTNANDWGSYIGFRGEEEVSPGIKAIWQIEQDVSIDSRSRKNSQWASRDSYIGLKTDGGTIRAGHLSDSTKSLENIIDPWEGRGIRTLNHFTRPGDRYTGIRYDSPEWGGFSFNAFYSPEDNNRYDQARKAGIPDLESFETTAGILNEITRYKDVASVGLNYYNPSIGIVGDYAYKRVNYGQGDSGEVHTGVIGYNANKIYAILALQYAKDYYGKNIKVKEGALTLSYDAGNVTPRISYARGEKEWSKWNHTEQYDQVILGADYNLSKRTAALISGGWIKNKAKGEQYGLPTDRLEAYSIGVGLKHSF